MFFYFLCLPIFHRLLQCKLKLWYDASFLSHDFPHFCVIAHKLRMRTTHPKNQYEQTTFFMCFFFHSVNGYPKIYDFSNGAWDM